MLSSNDYEEHPTTALRATAKSRRALGHTVFEVTNEQNLHQLQFEGSPCSEANR